MKKLTKFAAVISIIAVMLSLSVVQSFAATENQNDIEFSFVTDKTDYTDGEKITATIEIANNGDEDVSNVKVATAVPDGYAFADAKMAEQTVDVIHPQKTAKFTAEFVVKTSVDATAPVDSGVEVTTPVSPDSASDAVSATSDQTSNSSVKTGALNIVIAVALAMILVSAAVFGFIKFRRRTTGVLSVLLCATVIFGTLPVIKAAETTEDEAETERFRVSLEQDVNVASSPLKLTATVDYYLPVEEKVYDEVYFDGDRTFTRGEFLSGLANKLAIELVDLTDEENYIYFFGDSPQSSYAELAETFHNLGYLPTPDNDGYVDPEQDVPMFESEKTVTREYAAYVVAKAMGFEGEYELKTSDAALVTYTNEAAVMLSQKFMVEKNGEFKPFDALTGEDANIIFNRITYFDDSLVVEEGHEKNIVDYQDGVVTLNQEYTASESEDGTYTVELSASDKTDLLTSGTVFVLPESDEYIGGLALKVKEKKVENGKVVLTCEEPTLEETVSEFDFAGNAVALVDKAETPDGITVSYDENETDENAFDLSGSVSNGSLTYTFAEKEFDNGLTASGELTVSIPDITAKAKGKIFGGLSLKELTLTFTTKTEVSGNLSYDFGIPESSVDKKTGKPKFGSGKTELGRVPFAIGGGLSIDVVFFVNLDVAGTASISYATSTTTGIQYKDKAFRTIKDTSSEFKAFEANASAKIGLGIAARLTFLTKFDLIGVDAHCGLGVTIKFVVHTDVDPTLCCGDGSVYLYLTLELDQDTIAGELIKKLLQLELSWDIFDEDNSPLKFKLHTENLKWIKTGCTYGKGSILGKVKAQGTGEAIGGAQVKIYQKSTGNLVSSGFTKKYPTAVDGNILYTGEYLVQNLGAGDYEFVVMATGYKKASVDVTVEPDQRVVCEATMMLFRDGMEDEGTVSGRITNALTGSLVSSVNYSVRSGLNNSSGDVIASGKVNSPYSISLAPGYYSITFSKDGFVDETVSVSIASDSNIAKNIAMAPTSDITIADSSFRAVLTWGQYPYDLDSHMRFTSSDGSYGFHTYYSDKNYYRGGTLTANLDLDDTSSYGPETTTVYEMSEGTYSFYVHDYSNRNSYSSSALANSGAQVKLFSGSELVATFVIPENRGGTCWHVFDLNTETGDFDYVNEFSYESNPSYIGS